MNIPTIRQYIGQARDELAAAQGAVITAVAELEGDPNPNTKNAVAKMDTAIGHYQTTIDAMNGIVILMKELET